MSGINGAETGLVLPPHIAAEREEREARQASGLDQPIFEIFIRDTDAAVEVPRYHFRIMPNGDVQGFDGLGADIVVHNHLPELLAAVGQPIFETANTLVAAIAALTKGSAKPAKPEEMLHG